MSVLLTLSMECGVMMDGEKLLKIKHDLNGDLNTVKLVLLSLGEKLGDEEKSLMNSCLGKLSEIKNNCNELIYVVEQESNCWKMCKE